MKNVVVVVSRRKKNDEENMVLERLSGPPFMFCHDKIFNTPSMQFPFLIIPSLRTLFGCVLQRGAPTVFTKFLIPFDTSDDSHPILSPPGTSTIPTRVSILDNDT
ncbi:hypothetical protein FRC20_008153 [Serendipita sp. 405]|nr:hypothetical protein FRC15_008531 [Serendipita sp. 397]KAG8766226.1 hypothetical protein FRC16_007733 [Serendipita sp. 398]KAG8831311.1 hypothetical protein FRC20_008153 [Serendipita sp. 405]